MKTSPATPADWRSIFAVPPLAWQEGSPRTLDLDANQRIVDHIAAGGITRFLYGGNAHLHHLPLRDYEVLLEWLSGQSDRLWMIPSAGPSYGRAIDQASLLRTYDFPCVMLLPCHDPRDAAGLERGLREIAEAASTKLILYLKEEDDFGVDWEAGLDVVARLVEEGVCTGVKYAVVRPDPNDDPYLEALLQRVDRQRVLSGMGEPPVVEHLRDWSLPGFTTGSGCLQPHLCHALLEAAQRQDFERVEALRSVFMPLEELRAAWGASRVLHEAVALSGVAPTGAVPPFLSPLTAAQRQQLKPVARALVAQHLSSQPVAS